MVIFEIILNNFLEFMKNRTAVICARGGSKRVPRKNLLNLLGKPLLYYTINESIKSFLFNDIFVNSDDEEILSVASELGAKLYKRPTDYSGDNIFLIDVLKEMISTLSLNDDNQIAVLFPTVPLRTTMDIIDSHKLFIENKCLCPVVSVAKYEYPVHVALTINKHGKLEPLFKDHYKKSTRHDQQDVIYRANYAIIWNTAKGFMGQENLIGHQPIPYFMPLERSVDIDEYYQVVIAELLLGAKEHL